MGIKVTALYQILSGSGKYSYVIGDDKNIYRLPFLSSGRQYKVLQVKKHRKGYYLDTEYFEENEIKYEKLKEPFVLIDTTDRPF